MHNFKHFFRLSVQAIQQVAPLQAMEVGKLKKRITNFEYKQNEFRRDFCKMRFFQFKCKMPYEYLGQANAMINKMEINMKELQDSAVLFEVEVPEFKLLISCRREVIHSLIRGVLIESCSAGAKNFTNYVFCPVQFSGIIQNIENRCAIRAKF